MKNSLVKLPALFLALGWLAGCQFVTQPQLESDLEGAEVSEEALSRGLLKISTTPPTEESCAVPPSNLVGWWSGDNGAEDYSGYGHHGVLQGNMAMGEAYAYGGFVSQPQASYVEVPAAPELAPDTALTVEGWIYMNQYTFYPGIISLGNVETFEESFSLFLSPWGNLSMLVNRDASSGGRTMLVGPALSAKEWYHVVGVYDGSQVLLYVNGRKAASKSHSGALYPAPQDVVMGIMERDSDPLSQPAVHGVLDELSLYTRALSAVEILELYNAGRLGKCRDEATLASLASSKSQNEIEDPEVLESMAELDETSDVIDEWLAENQGEDPKTEAKLTELQEDIAATEEMLVEMIALQEQLEALSDPDNPGDPKEVKELEKELEKLGKEFNKDVDNIQKKMEKYF